VRTAVLAPTAALWAVWLFTLLWGDGRRHPLLPASTAARRRRATLTALVAVAGPAWAGVAAWGGPWATGAGLASALLAADLALLALAARRRQVAAGTAGRRTTDPVRARRPAADRLSALG
jgi:hypothetical protein